MDNKYKWIGHSSHVRYSQASDWVKAIHFAAPKVETMVRLILRNKEILNIRFCTVHTLTYKIHMISYFDICTFSVNRLIS